MSTGPRPPAYRELPVVEGAPPGSSWGLWGPEDQLGALNLLTDERTREAAALVRRGAVFPLNVPLEEPDPGLAWRTPPQHHFLRVGHQDNGNVPDGADNASSAFTDRDDYLDGLWLQGGSQWDGLAHVRHRNYGNYNGVPDADIHGRQGAKLGIDQWARRAIVGRGVLLDVKRYYEENGRPYDVESAHEITIDDLEKVIQRQGVEIRTGDILLLHTGWMENYLRADQARREGIIGFENIRTPGLAPVQEMAAYIWDLHVAAIASDTNGVEAVDPTSEYFLHSQLLALLGIPLGEYWALHDLAADCAEDGVYEVFLISVPLNVRGSIGSPPQAVAIK